MYDPDYEADLDASLTAQYNERKTESDVIELSVNGPVQERRQTVPRHPNGFGVQYLELDRVYLVGSGEVVADYGHTVVSWYPSRNTTTVLKSEDVKHETTTDIWTADDGFVNDSKLEMKSEVEYVEDAYKEVANDE